MSAAELEKRESFQAVRELWCGGCGYGVAIRRDPADCPICRQTNWRERPPLARLN
jgi:rubrerythrin